MAPPTKGRCEMAKVAMKLELIQVPVSDVDRAKSFYVEQVGFNDDHDHRVSDEIRFVQLTPPGSACSIAIGEGLTDAEHRCAMVELAIASNPHFECSRMEIQREGPSYAVDTLSELRAELAEAELYYIIGIDALAEIEKWHRPEEVIELGRFVAVTRPGFGASALNHLPDRYQRRIEVLETIRFDLSATDLRIRAEQGLPLRYLTSDAVVEYIQSHYLYTP